MWPPNSRARMARSCHRASASAARPRRRVRGRRDVHGHRRGCHRTSCQNENEQGQCPHRATPGRGPRRGIIRTQKAREDRASTAGEFEYASWSSPALSCPRSLRLLTNSLSMCFFSFGSLIFSGRLEGWPRTAVLGAILRDGAAEPRLRKARRSGSTGAPRSLPGSCRRHRRGGAPREASCLRRACRARHRSWRSRARTGCCLRGRSRPGTARNSRRRAPIPPGRGRALRASRRRRRA